MRKKIVIFLPQAVQSVSVEFDESFFNAYLRLLRAANEDELPFEVQDIMVYRAKTFPIDANRNECAVRFLEGIPTQGGGVYRADISLWIDMDHEIPTDAFVRLLKHDRPIVLGIYFIKVKRAGMPFYPVIFRAREDKPRLYKAVMQYPEKELFEVDMAGMGAACIHREVFEKLDMPYFKYMEHPEGSSAPDSTWKSNSGIQDISEDVWFWKQVKEKTPYPILVDPNVHFGHVGKLIIEKNLYKGYLAQYKESVIRQHGQEEFDKIWNQWAIAEPYKEIIRDTSGIKQIKAKEHRDKRRAS